MNDATLLQQSLKGDQAAFRTLYDRHSKSVFSYAFRMVGLRESAEDLTQDIFLSVLRRGWGYDASRPFRPWLLGMVRHAAIDWLRRTTRRTEVHATSGRPEGRVDPTADVEATELVERELAHLPPSFREAIWLCDGLELPYEEAAAIMNCDTGTVGSRVARARHILRERFSRNSHAV